MLRLFVNGVEVGSQAHVRRDADVDGRPANRREQRVERILHRENRRDPDYNRALTPAEVLRDMVAPITP